MATQVGEIVGRTASIDKAGVRTYSEQYQVISDTQIPPTAARNAVGISRFDAYAFDPAAKCVSITCAQKSGDEQSKIWTVTYEYTTELEDVTAVPTEREYEYQWSTEKWTQPVDFDINGDPVVNTINDFFAEPIEREQSRPILTVTRNEAAATDIAALKLAYEDRVNDDTFIGAPARSVRLTDISASSQKDTLPDESTVVYWRVSYTFMFKLDEYGWDIKVLNNGFHCIDDEISADDYSPCKTADGQSSGEYMLLAEDGTRLEPDGTPFPLVFEVYEEADFDSLSLI